MLSCVSVLIVLDIVTDVAYPDRLGTDDPLVAEVLAPADSVHELATDLHFRWLTTFFPPSYSLEGSSHDIVWYSQSGSHCHFWNVV